MVKSAFIGNDMQSALEVSTLQTANQCDICSYQSA